MEMIKCRHPFRQHMRINSFALCRKFFHNANPVIVHKYLKLYPNNLSVFPPKVKIKNIALDYKDTYLSHNVVYDPEEIYRKFKNTKDFVDHKQPSANSCNEHEILKICDHRCYKNRRIIFLIHWEKYGAAERTWECLEDLSCPALIIVGVESLQN